MLYVSEYKAPHKLTAPHLRVGLHPMDIFKDVVNRKTIPTAADPEGRFQYHAERLTAAAITQTYNYMIEGGLECGLLTTGETIVFLRVVDCFNKVSGVMSPNFRTPSVPTL
ncbi:hypothetical protein TruAng_009067 [Truncatella angustata]|nr:hypothetical protein TruAng_009067 [Truncatella angustata]